MEATMVILSLTRRLHLFLSHHIKAKCVYLCRVWYFRHFGSRCGSTLCQQVCTIYSYATYVCGSVMCGDGVSNGESFADG